MLSLICCPDGLWPPVRALCENMPPYLTAVTRHGWNSMLYGSLSLSEIVLCKRVAIYLQHSTLCANPSHCGLILLMRSVSTLLWAYIAINIKRNFIKKRIFNKSLCSHRQVSIPFMQILWLILPGFPARCDSNPVLRLPGRQDKSGQLSSQLQ